MQMKKIEGYEICITLLEGDFIESMKRIPKGQAEFNQWAEHAEKGLMSGHIDWNIIYECTREAMQAKGEEES